MMDSEREDLKHLIEEFTLKIISDVKSEESNFIEEEPTLRYVPRKIQRNDQGIITGYEMEREVLIKKDYSHLSTWLSEYKKSSEYSKLAELLSNYTKYPIENSTYIDGSDTVVDFTIINTTLYFGEGLVLNGFVNTNKADIVIHYVWTLIVNGEIIYTSPDTSPENRIIVE